MTLEQLDYYKSIAVDLYTDFYLYGKDECTLDKALENVAYKLKNKFEKHPVAGYVESGSLRDVLLEVYRSKEPNENESYLFDCKIHRNKMDVIERILKKL